MAVRVRFRDAVRRFVPPWLSDRHFSASKRDVAFRYLWSMVAPLDAAMETLVQGLQAPWPGVGTPTAFPLISRTRGIIRGQDESDEDYAVRLRAWLDTWRDAGSAETLARQIRSYLRNHPRVRIVNRAGVWFTVNEDGSEERHSAAWNWDGTSNPERSGYWSEIWIIVYPTQWDTDPPFLDTAGAPTWGSDTLGIGHDVTREEYDAVLGLIAQWKAAHTKVRAVIWTSDAALFDPEVPASLPDGTWGQWGNGSGSGSRVLGGRNVTTCRYWEPR